MNPRKLLSIFPKELGPSGHNFGTRNARTGSWRQDPGARTGSMDLHIRIPA